MSYVCIICDENLAYDSKSKKPSIYGKIITTTCGHVYHGHCLEDWSDASIKREREEALRASNNSNSSRHTQQKMPCHSVRCPICQTRIFMFQCIKIFPSEAIGSNALSKNMRESTSDVTNPFTNFSFVSSPTKTVLVIGDIVVWFREDDKEIGSVIWMGTINGVLNACVKFISPIGDSSTEIKEKELSNYDKKYCKMVPVSELILYVDCFGYVGVENGDSKPN